MRAPLPGGALAEGEAAPPALGEGAAAEPRRCVGGRGRPPRRLAARADHRCLRRPRARERSSGCSTRRSGGCAVRSGRSRSRSDSWSIPRTRLAPMHAAELIERKRNGAEIPAGELREFVAAYARGEIPDYQAAALLMAVWFRGLTPAETFAMTEAMVGERRARRPGGAARSPRRGQALDRRRRRQDHDRGGAGRRRVRRSLREDERPRARPHRRDARQARVHPGLPRRALDRGARPPGEEIGIAVAGQTADLVPADRKLYALRDVTATIDQVSLIAASIMSKKIAAGASALVLDVKVGEGAFMRTVEDARELARGDAALGEQAGIDVVCLLTDMDQPLGCAVGNALEVLEAWETLSGGGPPTSASSSSMRPRSCSRSRISAWTRQGRRRAETALADGSALAAYERWIRAQGGDPDPGSFCRARRSCARWRRRRAATSGRWGRGRSRSRRWSWARDGRSPEEPIDHAVGVVCKASEGIAWSGGRAGRDPCARRGGGRGRRGGAARRLRDRRRARAAAARPRRDSLSRGP